MWFDYQIHQNQKPWECNGIHPITFGSQEWAHENCPIDSYECG